MASIQERKRVKDVVWRVRIRKARTPEFSLTFDDYETACDWVIKHEKKFCENPQEYFDWKEGVYTELMVNRKISFRGILKPKGMRAAPLKESNYGSD